MTRPFILFATLAISASLAACGARPARDLAAEEAERAAAARTIHATALRVAVAKPGAKVCRQLTIGISERDWVRGVVVEVASDKVRIRIAESGRFPHALDGVALAPGVLVWDSPLNWTPCA